MKVDWREFWRGDDEIKGNFLVKIENEAGFRENKLKVDFEKIEEISLNIILKVKVKVNVP